MGKPGQKDELEFFPHDCDAVKDDKLQVFEETFGNDGYAFWFKALELIYKHVRADDSTGPFVLSDAWYEILRKRCHVSRQKFDKMLEVSTTKLPQGVGLFDEIPWKSDRILTSDSIRKRAKKIFQSREEKRKFRAGSGQDKGQDTPQDNGQDKSPTSSPNVPLQRTTYHIPSTITTEKEPTTHPVTPPGLVGAALTSFSLIKENLPGISNGDLIEAENACIKYSREWIDAALREATSHNQIKWRYVAAILSRWESERSPLKEQRTGEPE